MLNSIRPKIARTTTFVKEHKTIVSCAATAVVTAYVVRDRDVTKLKAITAHMLLKENEKFAYLLDATSFIDNQGLTEEFYAFAPRLRD
jgi:hypothetical protein